MSPRFVLTQLWSDLRCAEVSGFGLESMVLSWDRDLRLCAVSPSPLIITAPGNESITKHLKNARRSSAGLDLMLSKEDMNGVVGRRTWGNLLCLRLLLYPHLPAVRCNYARNPRL